MTCATYYRRHLTISLRNLVLIAIGPVVGAALLAWLLVCRHRDMSDPENSYSGQAWFGVGPPLVIGIGIFVAGVVLMIVWRAVDAVLGGAGARCWTRGTFLGPRRPPSRAGR